MRPFIFDFRKLPTTFRGFKVDTGISWDTIPEEFRLEEDELVPFYISMSEEKIIAYAEEHAVEICEELNDFALTLKDICNMITGGDFERHKKLCADAREDDIKNQNAFLNDDDDD